MRKFLGRQPEESFLIISFIARLHYRRNVVHVADLKRLKSIEIRVEIR